MSRMHHAAALLLLAVSACSGSTEDPTTTPGTGGGAGIGGSGGTGGAAGQAGSGGTGGNAGQAGAAGAAGFAGGGGAGGCDVPSYSSDCSAVTSFQCGFSSSCQGNQIQVSWHHHYSCDGQEEIASFTCTYDCPVACDDDYMDWPANGQDLVGTICVGGGGASGAGGTGTGGAAGAAGAAGTGGAGGCDAPSFSTDCSEVTGFQCGFSPSCEGNTAMVSWHHHWDCNGQEQITDFSCAYDCAAGCDETYMDWPADGTAFVSGICQ